MPKKNETTPDETTPDDAVPTVTTEYVKLANPDIGFIDPHTKFDISRAQVKELTAPVGTMTARLIASGALIKVAKPE